MQLFPNETRSLVCNGFSSRSLSLEDLSKQIAKAWKCKQ